MRTDREQSDENREEAGLEEALKLWVEIRQVDRKKGWERLEAEIGRQYGLRRQERRRRLGYFRWLAAAVILCFGIGGLLGPQIVSQVLRLQNGDYTLAFWIAGGAGIAGALLALLCRKPVPGKRHTS